MNGTGADLLGALARLGAALREDGVRVAIGDEIDAARALARIDIADPDELRRALLCTLRIRPRDLAAFERAFERTWLGAPAQRGAARPADPRAARPRLTVVRGTATAAEPDRAEGEPDPPADEPDGERPGASARALFRDRPFEMCDARDLAAMEPMLDQIARKLATRRSRRWVAGRAGHGRVDLRRTLRRSIATGGEAFQLARRRRPIEASRLVLLLDTSGSMESHTRFLIAFARSLRRVARRTEVFAFNTELVRITGALAASRPALLAAQIRRAVPDWSGGTRIGGCLAEFAARHLNALVDSRTIVVILSDGLDRGEPELIAASMRRIRARARRVLWLNPLAGDPRFEPTAAGMSAALPHLDLLAPAHDLASLERLLPHLRT
jgi:hypothetical protein